MGLPLRAWFRPCAGPRKVLPVLLSQASCFCLQQPSCKPHVPFPFFLPIIAARARLLALLKPSLGGLLWRSAKADVAHELGLPPQVQTAVFFPGFVGLSVQRLALHTGVGLPPHASSSRMRMCGHCKCCVEWFAESPGHPSPLPKPQPPCLVLPPVAAPPPDPPAAERH